MSGRQLPFQSEVVSAAERIVRKLPLTSAERARHWGAAYAERGVRGV